MGAERIQNSRFNPWIKAGILFTCVMIGYMGRRKVGEEDVRSLYKTSNGKSYGITIPLRAVRLFRWQSKQKLQIIVDEKRKRIIIEDWGK